MPKIYWDACLFIDSLQKKNKERLAACLELVEKAKRGDFVIITSAFTLIEVNRLEHSEKIDGLLREDQSRLILAFFNNSYIQVRPLDRETAEMAHEFTRTHALANGDAVHVATAIAAGVDVLYTWDEHKKRGRRGLLIHDGKIGTPPLGSAHLPLLQLCGVVSYVALRR